MKKRVPVATIMTENLVTVNVGDSLRQVNELLTKNSVRHLPVVSGEKLVGIVSKTDIQRLSFGDVYEGQGNTDEVIFDMLKLDQVMVSNPTTVKSEDTIREVAEIFSNVEFHALPVVDEDKIVGIVSTKDVIQYLLDQYE